MAGRQSKSGKGATKRRNLRISPELVEQAAEHREDGETFTDQVEDGLRRHIAARRRARKRKPT